MNDPREAKSTVRSTSAAVKSVADLAALLTSVAPNVPPVINISTVINHVKFA